MSKFLVDYSGLENRIYKKAYKLSEVHDKVEKVAFDVVRFKDEDDASKLWQIQSADDGEYIVALYDPEADTIKTASSDSWSVTINKLSNQLNFYYKGDPIVKVASDSLGIPGSELNMASKYLPEILASNKKLVKALLSELNESAKKDVLSKYPELF